MRVAQRDGELVVEKRKQAWILGLRGEHDPSTAETIMAEVEAVFAHGYSVGSDLRETTFIDSSVLAVLVAGRRQAESVTEDAFVVLCPAGACARKLLDSVGLSARVPVYETLNEALASFP